MTASINLEPDEGVEVQEHPRASASLQDADNSTSSVRNESPGEEDNRAPEEALECSICLDLLGSAPTTKLGCGHTFHETCLEELAASSARALCPLCRHPLPLPPPEDERTTRGKAWRTFRRRFGEMFGAMMAFSDPYLHFLWGGSCHLRIKRAVALTLLLVVLYVLCCGAAVLNGWKDSEESCTSVHVNQTYRGSRTDIYCTEPPPELLTSALLVFVLVMHLQLLKKLLRGWVYDFAYYTQLYGTTGYTACYCAVYLLLLTSCVVLMLNLFLGLWGDDEDVLAMKLMLACVCIDWLLVICGSCCLVALESAMRRVCLAHGLSLLLAAQYGSMSYQLYCRMLRHIGTVAYTMDEAGLITRAALNARHDQVDLHIVERVGTVVTVRLNMETKMLQLLEGATTPPIHVGVECDLSGMCPIVGPRYNKVAHNYDLCREEFEKLDAESKMAYECIPVPGARPQAIAPGPGRELQIGVNLDSGVETGATQVNSEYV